ncbi:hypothetical protein DVH24_038195 [Malus domestica]|uniref:F-box domain-containing protein n=1 Tax=Malus domestica TaxID=3750 RepID=A0A498K8R4_MALDO|nr:hypothetical protein DVH24_038195 [Malus domestica]
MARNLPEEIVHDILYRLPPKSLIRCASVCKPWNSITSTVQSLLITSLAPNSAYSTVPRAILSSNVNVRADEQREEHYNLHYDNHAFDEYCKLEFPIVPKMNKFLRVDGICNGLVFLADDNDRLGYTFMLCNPSIRKSVTLPKPHLSFKPIGRYHACIGFGFDAVTNDYKACRRLKNGDYEDFILAYDLGSDSFRGIMAPKSFHSSWTSQLSVSGDGKSIALFQPYLTNTEKLCFNIWVMKEYGKEESWTKLTTLSPSGPQRGVRYRPLCFRKCGDVVLAPTYGYWDDTDITMLNLMLRASSYLTRPMQFLTEEKNSEITGNSSFYIVAVQGADHLFYEHFQTSP